MAKLSKAMAVYLLHLLEQVNAMKKTAAQAVRESTELKSIFTPLFGWVKPLNKEQQLLADLDALAERVHIILNAAPEICDRFSNSFPQDARLIQSRFPVTKKGD